MYEHARRQIRGTIPLCRRRCELVVLLGALLAGCASPLSRFSATPTPTPDCGMLGTCQVVLPRCGPAITSPQQGGYLWADEQAAFRLTLPRNIQMLVGFQPLLPTSLPAGLSLYRVEVFGPISSFGHLLLHVGYLDFFDRSAQWPFTVLGLDESSEALGPLDDLNFPGQPLQVDSQAAVVVNGQPAMLYHVLTPQVSAGAYELIWKAGSVTLRLLVAPLHQGVQEVYTPSTPPEQIDLIRSWLGGGDPTTGAKDTALLAFATRVVPFTGCA